MTALSFSAFLLKTFRRMGSLKLVFLVFCFFLLFILLVEQPGSEESKRLKKARFLFPKMNAGETTKVYLSGPLNPSGLTLQREGGRWLAVNGHPFPADEDRVRRFLEALQDLKKGPAASVNPEREAIFGLDSGAPIHIEIRGRKEAPMADFFVGRQEGADLFIRLQQSTEVIRVPSSLSLWLSVQADDWRDKVILSVDEKDARRVVLTYAKEDAILERRNDAWRLLSPVDAEPDSFKVRSLFEELKSLRASGFAESLEGSQADFLKPAGKISIRLADGSVKVVLFAPKNADGSYFARNGDPGTVYKVSQEIFDRLFGLKLEVPASDQKIR